MSVCIWMMVRTDCCLLECPGMTCRESVVFGYDWPRTCRTKRRAAYSSVIKLEVTPPGERLVDLCHTACYPPVILRSTGLHYLSRKRNW